MIKLMMTAATVLTGLALAAPAAQACISQVDERALYDVRVVGAREIDAQTGDYVRLEGRVAMHPGHPNHIERIELEFDKKLLRLVADGSLFDGFPEGGEPVGVMGRSYYLRAVGEGDAVIKVKRFVGIRLVETTEQKVRIRLRPTFRCG